MMRATCLTAGLVLSALLCAGANGADPRLLNLVMPDADTLAGVNVTNAEITPFGQFVLRELTTSADDGLQKFIGDTGFDPRRDVTEILAASSTSAGKSAGLVLALGSFPVDQLTAAMAKSSPDLSVQTYNGATLVSGGAKMGNHSVGFIGNNIAIVGDTAAVKAAIDRSSGANSIVPALAAQVQSLSLNQDAWAVTTNSVSALIPGLGAATGTAPGAATTGLPPMAQMFKGIVGSSGGIRFGDTVVITGQAVAVDAPTAKSLADVLQALASIAAMAGGGKDANMAAMAQLMQGLKVAADGVDVNLTLTVPEVQLEAIVNQLKNRMPAGRPAAVKPALAPVVPVAPLSIAGN